MCQVSVKMSLKYPAHVRLNIVMPYKVFATTLKNSILQTWIYIAVGPGASKNKEYKNPEYFCYHVESFGEAEVELAQYRLPAPSNKKPFHR